MMIILHLNDYRMMKLFKTFYNNNIRGGNGCCCVFGISKGNRILRYEIRMNVNSDVLFNTVKEGAYCSSAFKVLKKLVRLFSIFIISKKKTI